VFTPDKNLILVGESPGDVEDALVMLRRVGLDLTVGFLEGGIGSWINQGMKVSNVHSISGECRVSPGGGIKQGNMKCNVF